MNPYAIPPLVVLISVLSLGIYIISKDSRSRVNQIVGLSMFILFLSGMGEFGLRLSTTVASAEIWDKLLWSAIAFMGPVFLHIALLAPRRKKILNNRAIYLILYLPSLSFLLLAWGTNFLVVDFATRYWGLDPLHGAIIMAPVVYNSIFFILGIGIFSQSFRRSISTEKKQTLVLLMGLVVIYVGGFIASAALPRIFDIPEVAYLFNISGGVLIVYGIVKYKLFVIPPISRFFVPAPEEYLRTKPKYKLDVGRSYLIKEKEPDRSAKLFMDQTTHGISGLWITSLHPKKVEKYGLRRTPVLSLTTKRFSGEVTLFPSRLDRAKALVENQLVRARERSVVLVDCFKELIVVNGFKRALGFLEELKRTCAENDSNLIVLINPSEFTKEQLAVIEREIER